MITLTALAALALGAASVYATCKAWSAACRLDVVSWACWGQLAEAAGALLSALISSASE